MAWQHQCMWGVGAITLFTSLAYASVGIMTISHGLQVLEADAYDHVSSNDPYQSTYQNALSIQVGQTTASLHYDYALTEDRALFHLTTDQAAHRQGTYEEAQSRAGESIIITPTQPIFIHVVGTMTSHILSDNTNAGLALEVTDSSGNFYFNPFLGFGGIGTFTHSIDRSQTLSPGITYFLGYTTSIGTYPHGQPTGAVETMQTDWTMTLSVVPEPSSAVFILIGCGLARRRLG